MRADDPAMQSIWQLTLCSMGHSAFQHLYAGFDLGVFDLLYREPGLQREDIAIALKLEKTPARCLLLGLTALDFVIKSTDVYFNSDLINELIRLGKHDLMKKFLRFQAKIVYLGQADYLESLRSNTNVGIRRFSGQRGHLYDCFSDDESLAVTFFDYMSAWSAESLPLLFEAVDFNSFHLVVDVGGGDATVAVEIIKKFSETGVRILDIPSICDLAEERIAASGLSQKITANRCDVFVDSFPVNGDCFLFVHFLVIWSPEENIFLLKKAFDALPSGGKVVIFSSMTFDDETGPLFAALDSAYFMAIPARGGFIYSFDDYIGWLELAGFREICCVSCKSWWSPHGVVCGTKC